MRLLQNKFSFGLASVAFLCLECQGQGVIGVGSTGGATGGHSSNVEALDGGTGGAAYFTMGALDASSEASEIPDSMTRCGASGVGLIYVIDSSNHLFSFDPANGNVFTQVNALNCPNPGSDIRGIGGAAAPFSMGIDHTGIAWVLYTSGLIFNVDVTKNNSPCTAMTPGWTAGTDGFYIFGMGFVADASGTLTEKLYIAGGSASDLADGNLGYIDPSSRMARVIAPIPMPLAKTDYGPELTGTGDALLYGYYPGVEVSYVVLFDRSNGTLKQIWKMPPIGTRIAHYRLMGFRALWRQALFVRDLGRCRRWRIKLAGVHA